MRNCLLVFCRCCSTVSFYSQSDYKSVKYNFGFEEQSPGKELPDHWFNWGSGYDLISDTQERNSGKGSILIRSAGDRAAEDVGSVGYAIPANFTETQRVGIVPDFEVRPTVRGMQQGRDELLEKAIEIIKEQ